MPSHPFRIVNVFTQDQGPFTGNPLCVIESAVGLSTEQMQALARQFNLSETTFILPSTRANARVRIFTPSYEMAFAGHPTLGSAHVCRALELGGDSLVLEMQAGLIPVRASRDRWTLTAPAATSRELDVPRETLAAALGIKVTDIGERPLWVKAGKEQLVVPLTSTDLLAQPDATGPLQAAVVDDGPASAAAKAVAAGPLTTGLYLAARDRADIGLEVPAGDVYQWSMEGTPYPAFALRTADGGALVLYAMYLNSTVAVPGYINDANPIQPGAAIKVPQDLLPLLPSGQPSPRVRLAAQTLFSFAAIDPPATSSKITVLAIGGGLNYATAS